MAIHLIGDVCQMNYIQLLKQHNLGSYVDYLQIDLDAENRSTLTLLERVDQTVFRPIIRLQWLLLNMIVTVEISSRQDPCHDKYLRNMDTRGSLVTSLFFFDHKWCEFEDLYVHPHLIDPVLIETILRHPQNQEKIVHTQCIEIIKTCKQQRK